MVLVDGQSDRDILVVVPYCAMVSYSGFVGATSMLGRGGTGKVPFDIDLADDKRDVGEIDNA